MSANQPTGQDRDRQQQNRYAREVLSGSDVRLSHRPAAPQPGSNSNQSSSFSIPSVGSNTRAAYLLALAALAIIGIGVYFFGGFELASVIFFILSLVLMASWFVF